MDLVVLCDHDVQRHEGVRRPRSQECNFVNKEKRILRFFFINFTVKKIFFFDFSEFISLSFVPEMCSYNFLWGLWNWFNLINESKIYIIQQNCKHKVNNTCI